VRFQIRVDTITDQLYFDAVSLYRVNSEGMIYEHFIESVIRNDLVERSSLVSLLNARQVAIAPGAGGGAPDQLGL
jgi:hypothetical protein